jgi:16S rRNA (adenine1518-N6/adenine1519-N6)-dimethyltransferase
MGRRFGQHFMVDERVLRREVDYADVSKDDVILEIGPGTGNLTKYLVERAKKVYAIEKDRALARLIEDEFPEAEMIIGDAMEVDWPDFDKMVSNIPYEISSPLTFKLLEHDFKLAVITYQLEFAERLVAYAGDWAYSRLSVMAYYRAEMEMLERVPKSAFRPRPKVDSAIVRIIPREEPPFHIENEKLFEEVVRILFSARRKTVRAALKPKYGVIDTEYAPMRVEELTPEEIGDISNLIFEKIKKGAVERG